MDAARRYRRQPVREDAGERGDLYVRVPIEETWPEWHCDCGTRNDRWRIACAMCGTVREDVDQCV